MKWGIKQFKYNFLKLTVCLTVIISGLFFFVQASPVTAAPGLNIDGASCIQTILQGKTYVHSMVVTNTSSAALNILVEADGLAQNSDGTNISVPADEDTNPFSALPYIYSIDNPSFYLEAGGSKTVNADIRVPEDATAGTRYAMINIYSLPSGEGQVGVSVAVNVIVVITVPESIGTIASTPQITGEITDLSVSEIEPGQPITIYTTFKNTGSYYYKVKNEVTIKNENAEIVSTAATAITASSIIPTFSRLLEVTPSLTEFDAGTYQVESNIFLGDGTLLDTETTSFVVDKNHQSTTASTLVQQETQPFQTVSSQPPEKTTSTQTQQGSGPINLSWILPVYIIAGVLVIGIIAILWTTRVPARRRK